MSVNALFISCLDLDMIYYIALQQRCFRPIDKVFFVQNSNGLVNVTRNVSMTYFCSLYYSDLQHIRHNTIQQYLARHPYTEQGLGIVCGTCKAT